MLESNKAEKEEEEEEEFASFYARLLEGEARFETLVGSGLAFGISETPRDVLVAPLSIMAWYSLDATCHHALCFYASLSDAAPPPSSAAASNDGVKSLSGFWRGTASTLIVMGRVFLG